MPIQRKKSKVRKTFDLKKQKPKKPEDDPNVKLNEGSILGDIISNFDNPDYDPRLKSTSGKEPKLIKKTNIRRFKPRKIAGLKHDGWPEYIRSEGELKREIKEKLGTSKITLMNVIKLFTHHNMKLADNFTVDYDIKEIKQFREYARKKMSGGKRSPEEWDDLLKDIKKNGIKQAGYLHIERKKNGDITVLLGEGNHRLAMAEMVGIKKMPLYISYYP